MGIVSTKELGRTFEQEIKRFPIARRRWVCVLSDDTTLNNPTAETAVLAATSGAAWGAAHPTFADFKLRKVSMNEGFEGSPYHVEVIAEYGNVTDEELLTPTARAAVWGAEARQGQVPALFFYDGSDTYPLTNSAFDFFPGLTTDESMVSIKVTKNFSGWPTGWFAAMNFVNDATYFGCAAGTIKVNTVNVSLEMEEWGGGVVKFYKATAELLYRQSGWALQLPDVGWNFIASGQKRRAMVFDFENSEWVPSPNPIGLNGFGAPSPTGYPEILVRRVNPMASLSGVFGTPP
jgi:hypothetical protein